MNASRDRLRKDVSSRSRRVRPLRCEPKSVDSGTASEGDLLGIKSRTPSAGGAGGNRGLWTRSSDCFESLEHTLVPEGLCAVAS